MPCLAVFEGGFAFFRKGGHPLFLVLRRKERIAQLVVAPVIAVSFVDVDHALDETARSADGFGSTGLGSTGLGGFTLK